MFFPNKAGQKKVAQELTEHYLLNELWSDLDETSQAAVSGGVAFIPNSKFLGNSAGSIENSPITPRPPNPIASL